MKRRTRSLGVVVLLACGLLLPMAACAGGHPAGAHDSRDGAPHFPPDEDLDVMLRYLVEDGLTPGIVLGIVEADGSSRIVSHGSGGAGTEALGGRSGFDIGSIGKTFTGTLLADMVARDEVALEDPVSKHLPDSVRVPSRDGREITLLDLATHRSGLPHVPDDFVPPDPWDPYADFTLDSLYAFLSRHELERAPGAEALYSNLGMGLLGHALASAAGTTYEGLLRERILEPLGMTGTGFEKERGPAGGMTKGHREGEVVPYWSVPEALQGMGGLRSTMEDMLKYLQANMGPAQSDLERAMREAHGVQQPFIENVGIGLGWRVDTRGGRTILWHGGAGGGFTSRIAFDPERRVGFVRLTNTIPFTDEIGLSLLRLGPPVEIPEVAVPAEALERYAGTYALSPEGAFVVRLEEDETLTSWTRGTSRYRLYAESDSAFFLKRLPARVIFTADASGAVEGMTIATGSARRTLPRVSDDAPLPPRATRTSVLDLPLRDGEMAGYEGTYRIEVDGRTLDARVYAEEGRLMARLFGGAPVRLLHQGDSEFRLEAEPSSRVVFTLRDGKAEALSLDLGGRTFSGRRVGGASEGVSEGGVALPR